MITEKELTAIFIGNDKLGFGNGIEYKIIIHENKKRGYLIVGLYDYTNDKDCNMFVPYSSEIMIKRDWEFK